MNSASSRARVQVFSVLTVDRMFTTTPLSDHVQDHMISRQHQPQRVATLGIKAHRRVRANTHERKRTTDDYDSTTRLTHFHGSGASSLKPQIYEAMTELDDRTRNQSFPGAETLRNQPRATGSPEGSPARDSAGELRAAPRPHVQSDQDAEFDGSVYQEVDIADIVKVKDTIEELDLPKGHEVFQEEKDHD